MSGHMSWLGVLLLVAAVVTAAVVDVEHEYHLARGELAELGRTERSAQRGQQVKLPAKGTRRTPKKKKKKEKNMRKE